MKKAMALPIYVYRQADGCDCTNGGISAEYDRLLCLCDAGFIEVDLDHPPKELVKIVSRTLPRLWDFSGDGDYESTVYHIEPYAKPEHVGWMMGGNYAASSDSRFADMVGGIYGAIPVHDRQETQELYDRLSM